MKRILIHLLLLSTLFSGLAFAWDNHPEAMVGYDSVALDLLSSADQISANESGETHSDHCGHASSHLIALVFNSINPVNHSVDTHRHTFSAPAILRYTAPLLRPPIS